MNPIEKLVGWFGSAAERDSSQQTSTIILHGRVAQTGKPDFGITTTVSNQGAYIDFATPHAALPSDPAAHILANQLTMYTREQFVCDNQFEPGQFHIIQRTSIPVEQFSKDVAVSCLNAHAIGATIIGQMASSVERVAALPGLDFAHQKRLIEGIVSVQIDIANAGSDRGVAPIFLLGQTPDQSHKP